MYEASLNYCCPASGVITHQVWLLLSDEEVEGFLVRLRRGDANEPFKVRGRRDQKAVALSLTWKPGWGGFTLLQGDHQLAFIPLDELKGSLGKPTPRRAMPCTVCIVGDFDVWRRGILDLDTGEAFVYTCAPLGKAAGVRLTFQGRRGDEVRRVDLRELRLTPNGALRVPERQLYQLELVRPRSSAPAADDHNDRAIEQLSNLLEQTEKLFRECAG